MVILKPANPSKKSSGTNARVATLGVLLLAISLAELYALVREYQSNAYLQKYVLANPTVVYGRTVGLFVLALIGAFLAYHVSKTGTGKIGRAWKRVRPYSHWRLAVLVLVLSVVLSLLNLVDPYLIKILIDSVLIPKRLSILWFVLGAFLAAELVSTGVGIAFSYFQRRYEEQVMLDVKRDLFRHLERLDLEFHKGAKVGDLISRFISDISGVQDLIETISIALRDSILGIGTFIVIYLINWQVALFSLIVLPLYAIVNRRYGPRVRTRAKSLRKTAGDITGFLQERVSHIKAIKIFQREEEESQAYVKQAQMLIRSQLHFTLFNRTVNAILYYIGYLPTFFVLGFGAYEVLNGSLSIGGLMAVYAYTRVLLGPFSTFGQFGLQLGQNMAAVDRVFEIFDREPKIIDGEGAEELRHVLGELTFYHVSFQYATSEKVLENVSFTVRQGQKVALVGPSGAGKTTIADLTCRFYDPLAGAILLDGHELQSIRLRSLRQHVGLVTQRPMLYNLSIRENIRYGRLDASAVEISRAAELAGVNEVVANLEQGYDTVIGERGARLSEGQGQRISLARMLLKNPSVLILDEATSSLDAESEEKIHDAVNQTMRRKTVLIIAHRLSTIKDVDKIFVLKDHRITEEGTFAELMTRKGDFYELFRQQAESIESEWRKPKIEILEGARGNG